MRHRSYFYLFLIFSFFAAAGSAFAQASVKPSVITGDVVSVSESGIVVKTKEGNVEVTLLPTTEFKRVPPENPVLKAAVAVERTEIEVGDKLLVTGVFGESKTTLPARSVYLMSKSDLAAKQKKEAQEWATRGISGKVSAVNASANQVTVEVRGLMNSTSVVVSPKETGEFKRYAPNSIKYSEAVESSIADIKPGDMLRALGDRSQDGTAFAAEVIVTGAFQTVAGTVKAVDAENNIVTVMDMVSKKDVEIKLGPASLLKRFPEEMALRLAQFGSGGAPGGAGGIRPAGGTPPQQAPGGQGNPGGGRPGFGGGGARGGIDDMFERFPAINISDLKAGDVIAVSSSRNGDSQHITAIKLLAGVEPFLRAAQAGSQGRGGRGGGQNGSFTIPGLDGFDFP